MNRAGRRNMRGKAEETEKRTISMSKLKKRG